jgi:hypothetical protein
VWLHYPTARVRRCGPGGRTRCRALPQLLDAYVNNEYFSADVVRRSAAAAAHLAEWVVGCQRCALPLLRRDARPGAAVVTCNRSIIGRNRRWQPALATGVGNRRWQPALATSGVCAV